MTITPKKWFSARVVKGSQRGRLIGSPTLNLDLRDVPSDLRHGIYACTAFLDEKKRPAVMHYGPRPVFQDTIACEVHVLDIVVPVAPQTLTVSVVKYIREVMDFPHEEGLRKQIRADIEAVRAILKHQ